MEEMEIKMVTYYGRGVLHPLAKQGGLPGDELRRAQEDARDLGRRGTTFQDGEKDWFLAGSRAAAEKYAVIVVDGLNVGLRRGQEEVGYRSPAAGAARND